MKQQILLFFFMLVFSLYMEAQNSVKIIPLPVELKETHEPFVIDSKTYLKFDRENKELGALAHYFKRRVERISGLKLSTNPAYQEGKTIHLSIQPETEMGKEGYSLDVQAAKIEIKAATRSGIFYGMQSLLQTLPAIRTNQQLIVPGMRVKDHPRFSWRGFMLDVSRHFYSPETIKEMIDLMSTFKMNTLHWHLTDDQGWRLEIKKYPKLTSVGAWRQEKEGAIFYNKDTSYLKGKPTYLYGGYYTQEQVKDLIAYAQERNVTIVPEIEMPGHSGAALAAYPQYSCNQMPQEVPNIEASGDFDSFNSNYCPGNPATYTFLKNVLTEVMALFPSTYIHIGGDEVDKTEWKKCSSCQALMKREHLKNEEELQSYFIKKIEDFIISKNRKMVGWGEILEGGLAPEATVMSWIGEKRGIEAAKMQHDVIMCPSDPLYFNRYQTDSIQYEPLAAKFSINTLKRVYEYDPVPKQLNTQEQKYIIGSQALIWTEFISSVEHLEYMLLPRMCALAEIVWTPRKQQNFESFKDRLQPRLKAFEETGIRYFNKKY